MLEFIENDLLKSEEEYICHQCNCLTTYAKGIAGAIFSKFPWSDIYKDRTFGDIQENKMGSIVVCGNGVDQRFVINMIAQIYPGKPKYADSKKDGFIARENAFKECLRQFWRLDKKKKIKSIAFPFKIGCALAGGNWDNYLSMLEVFSNNISACVRIYKYDTKIIR